MRETKKFLSLFFKNEEKVSRLYKIYSRKIAGQKKFWKELSESEDAHVRALKEISQRYRGQGGLFKANKHLVEIAGYIGRFVDAEIEKARKEKVSLASALEAALRIEQSMIEKKCFEIIKPEKTEILKVFRRLNKETNDHRKILLKNYQNNL